MQSQERSAQIGAVLRLLSPPAQGCGRNRGKGRPKGRAGRECTQADRHPLMTKLLWLVPSSAGQRGALSHGSLPGFPSWLMPQGAFPENKHAPGRGFRRGSRGTFRETLQQDQETAGAERGRGVGAGRWRLRGVREQSHASFWPRTPGTLVANARGRLAPEVPLTPRPCARGSLSFVVLSILIPRARGSQCRGVPSARCSLCPAGSAVPRPRSCAPRSLSKPRGSPLAWEKRVCKIKRSPSREKNLLIVDGDGGTTTVLQLCRARVLKWCTGDVPATSMRVCMPPTPGRPSAGAPTRFFSPSRENRVLLQQFPLKLHRTCLRGGLLTLVSSKIARCKAFVFSFVLVGVWMMPLIIIRYSGFIFESVTQLQDWVIIIYSSRKRCKRRPNEPRLWNWKPLFP